MLANCRANKAPPASGLHNDILAGVNLLLLHVLVGQTVASARARDVWFVNASMTNAWLSRLYICMTNYYLYILHPCQSPTLINSRCLLAPSSRASKARTRQAMQSPTYTGVCNQSSQLDMYTHDHCNKMNSTFTQTPNLPPIIHVLRCTSYRMHTDAGGLHYLCTDKHCTYI